MSAPRGPQGRTLASLLRAFGPEPPARPRDPEPAPERSETGPRVPRRGISRPGWGWSPVEAPLVVCRAATSEIGGLWPLLDSATLPPVGARLGYDALSGAVFYCHPVEWVLGGITSNPNIIVFGEPGRGKSSAVLALAVRLMPFGVRTVIAGDVKGEYSPVVRALGAEPIRVGAPGVRINPLDLGPLGARWSGLTARERAEEASATVGRWVRLLVALTEAAGHPATPTHEMVLSATLRRLAGVDGGADRMRSVTIPEVHHALSHPDPELWRQARFPGEREFLDAMRGITDALGTLIRGPLAGLFDGDTTVRLDWSAPIQSLDLERLASRGDQAIAFALTLLGSWVSTATDLRRDGEIRLVVRDEVWRQMRLGLRAVQTVDADLRLSRRHQTIQVLAAHKPSDLLTVGAAGSTETAIAKDLLALCATRVLFGQSTRVADELADALALGEREHQAITGWATGRPGRALWKLGTRPGFKVTTVLTSPEKRLFDTNAQLRPRRR
ncbi:ATP-binding protein [Streptoalloteichus hindustanus]|uniref:AAA-like domain-containing protein n=1 Tax=Streptoalloteichus hindustanus TaxID=2017 RepID=A0A1M5M8W5_STRHI|nr:ATP-binding protein [Streptoalloteichus hindustanus]SHG73678.1 hypothetical protein SAMN05444320_11333 [Streptoalloteichus hindustanus]